MEASASSKINAEHINGIYGFILTSFDSSKFSPSLSKKNTVIKYTRLPDYDIGSKAPWPSEEYKLEPRVRRFVTIDDAEQKSHRSLKIDSSTSNKVVPQVRNRKIVTIAEDVENNLYPKFSSERKTSTGRSSRSIEVDFTKEKLSPSRTMSRLPNATKYSKEVKMSAKSSSPTRKKEIKDARYSYRSKHINNPPAVETTKPRYQKNRDVVKNVKTNDALMRTSISKNLMTPSVREKETERGSTYAKNKPYKNTKNNDTYKKSSGRRSAYSPPSDIDKVTHKKDVHSKHQSIAMIRVPLDNRQSYKESISTNEKSPYKLMPTRYNTADCGIGADGIIDFKHVNISTEPLPKTVDQVTEMDDFPIDTRKYVDSNIQTDTIKDDFDSLEIPNVTLTKETKNESNEILCNNNVPNPDVCLPSAKVSNPKEDSSTSDSDSCRNSYIISRATLTYTTRQKINFEVVGTNDVINSNHQAPSPLAYPMNVMTVFKNELKSKKSKTPLEEKDKKHTTNVEYTSCLNELKSLNCSYIFNNDKLMKPSDIISTIRVNNGLLPSDYICEQFQRELNFIDSFFESLQYLESCSLSDKCISDDKVENLVNTSALFDQGFDAKNTDYDNFLTNIENGASTYDSDTMASKSLCLLNLLIRDEQRRAKNLLFVLKMREDALKDFTKSQILWLEKKKKHENTDISTLKKKQRGALLKLQHECGEMQRMRKALLTLSEKRKVALIKTKKNIELKLKNNVDVEQIILGKKKLKRSTSGDRNTAPLKCFDLSSSGCEDSTTSRTTSEAAELPESAATVTSAEKCVQTSDSVLGSIPLEQSTSTAAENFVGVDGGYLNILFHNLALPQIFSSGKQYEVNEEALKNIVQSSNNQNHSFSGGDLEKLLEQIKNKELDRSSSPSTAHSLVEEFDQYYKNLAEDDSGPVASPDITNEEICEVQDVCDSMVDQTPFIVKEIVSATSQTQTGPLPVPVGAAAPDDPPAASLSLCVPSISSESSISEANSFSSQPLCGSSTSLGSASSPVQCEAEELMRQQLEIEREIKALEQQQCRWLVVREIPDKPPPPYTPPAEARLPKLPRPFSTDSDTQVKVESLVNDPESVSIDPTDPYDLFVKDFSQEALERHKSENSDKPWDACNLLPQKQTDDGQTLSKKVSQELKEVLKGALPTVVSGFSSRRSDHIDDILFTEWRRCEPEWTNIHTDEAVVKGQLFESIFQKILTQTIDEYRHTVHCTPSPK